MTDLRLLNPFRELFPAQRREVARQRAEAAQVRERFEGVLTAYRQLINDPRYAAITGELEASLGEMVQQLVTTAEGCAHCAPAALRVKVLNDVVSRPLHQLFLDAQRSRMEPVPEMPE